MTLKTIGLLGNPNCGKSTLFNRLTGANQRVGNWPGVTVERKTGSLTHAGERFEIIDLPGIYSEARRRMGPQLIAHMLMIALIVVGNIIYFMERKKGVS